MAKTLKDFLNERQLGPMVVKNPDEQKFIDKHVVAKTADRNGNDDELFKGSKVKMADRPKHRKGYNPGEDEEVYEALKGAQHKIDANKNGKVDAHDFHLLRKKKKVAEEAEELEELSTEKLLAYRKKAKAGDIPVRRGVGIDTSDEKIKKKTGVYNPNLLQRAKAKLRNEEAEELDELSIATMKSYGDKRARTAFSGGRKPGQSVDAGIAQKSRQSNSLSLARTKINRARDTGSTVLNKEEIEQIDELSIGTMKSYGDKRARTVFSGGRKPGESVDAAIDRKSKQSNSLSLARTKINRARDTGSTVLNKEEIEQIDELSHDTLRRYRMKAKSIGDNEKGDINYRAKGRELAGRKSYGGRMAGIEKAKVMAKEEADQIDELSEPTVRTYYNKAGEQGKKIADKMKMGGGDWSKDGSDTKTLKKRAAGRTMALKRRSGEIKMSEDAIDEKMSTSGETPSVYGGRASSAKEKMIADFNKPKNKNEKPNRYTKEEAIDEKLDMKKASMGTVVKDFQKSDAPQFMGKSQKKRQVMAIAAKLSAERGGKPLNKEERLLTKLADISETHQRTMVSVFEKLNEDNQYAFMQACDTADGIEQMLDFSISYRGE